jgi:hypothetical protein
MTLEIGYAQDTITPALDRPVYLAGFGRDRRAESVHDDLYVRALALQYGQTRLVVAALDLIGLGRLHCQEIERRINDQVPGIRLWLSCTHTHHGPDTIGLWGPDLATPGVDLEFVGALKDTVTQVSLEALGRVQPVSMRSISVQVPGVAKNARDPRILDEELTCLQFCLRSAADEAATLVTWLVFPCHPEVLGDNNPHITSDYVDGLRREVEAQTAAPCLVTVGAIGGMMTPDVEAHSFSESEQMGRALAHAALRALSQALARPVEFLAYTRYEYAVPMDNPVFRMAMQAGLLPNLLDEMGAVITEANLLRIGPAWLFGVPGELLPKLGLAFKAQMKKAGAEVAAIVGLTNDELGYILPREEYVFPDNPFDPGAHYEETMSLGPEAGPSLQAALRVLLASN